MWNVLSIIGLLGWLLWLNWKLAVVTFVIAPPAIRVFRAAGRRLRYTSRELQKNLGDITLDETTVGAAS